MTAIMTAMTKNRKNNDSNSIQFPRLVSDKTVSLLLSVMYLLLIDDYPLWCLVNLVIDDQASTISARKIMIIKDENVWIFGKKYFNWHILYEPLNLATFACMKAIKDNFCKDCSNKKHCLQNSCKIQVIMFYYNC